VGFHLLRTFDYRLGPVTGTAQGEDFRGEVTFRGREGDHLVFEPSAAGTVFSPDALDVRAGYDCSRNVGTLQGEKGLIVQGSVQPPLSAVQITLEVESTQQLLSYVTKDDGRFEFGPLKRSTTFK